MQGEESEDLRAVEGSPLPGPPTLRAELSAREPLPPTGNRRLQAHPARRELRPLPVRSGEAHVGSSSPLRGRVLRGAWSENGGWRGVREATPISVSQWADSGPQRVFGGFSGGSWPRMRGEPLRGPEVVSVPFLQLLASAPPPCL